MVQNWILNKGYMRPYTGFVQLSLGTSSERSCKHCNEHSDTQQAKNRLDYLSECWLLVINSTHENSVHATKEYRRMEE